MPIRPTGTPATQPTSVTRQRLGDVEVVAGVLQVSSRTVWRRVADGTLPKPISLGRAKRWDLSAIEGWIAAHGKCTGAAKA